MNNERAEVKIEKWIGEERRGLEKREWKWALSKGGERGIYRRILLLTICKSLFLLRNLLSEPKHFQTSIGIPYD